MISGLPITIRSAYFEPLNKMGACLSRMRTRAEAQPPLLEHHTPLFVDLGGVEGHVVREVFEHVIDLSITAGLSVGICSS